MRAGLAVTETVEYPCENCGEPVRFASFGDSTIGASSWGDGTLRVWCTDCRHAFEATT